MLVKLITDKRDKIIPKFSSTVTKKEKLEAWANIAQQLQGIGVVVSSPAHLRDTVWANIRRATVKRYNDQKKTGAQGGKWSDLDNLVMDLEGRESANVVGIGVDDISLPTTSVASSIPSTSSQTWVAAAGMPSHPTAPTITSWSEVFQAMSTPNPSKYLYEKCI